MRAKTRQNNSKNPQNLRNFIIKYRIFRKNLKKNRFFLKNLDKRAKKCYNINVNKINTKKEVEIMLYTPKFLIAYSKICKTNQPFYASEFGLSGGQITALSNHGYITETGNAKTILIPIDTYEGELYKKVTVKEWVATPVANAARVQKLMIEEIDNYINMAEALKQIKETI